MSPDVTSLPDYTRKSMMRLILFAVIAVVFVGGSAADDNENYQFHLENLQSRLKIAKTQRLDLLNKLTHPTAPPVIFAMLEDLELMILRNEILALQMQITLWDQQSNERAEKEHETQTLREAIKVKEGQYKRLQMMIERRRGLANPFADPAGDRALASLQN